MNPRDSNEFESLLDYLYKLQRLGIKTGLEHSQLLLDACGNPEKELEIFHIAGTNGKGSVSANITSILRSAGYRTGLYTSPHLVRFNERIRINGNTIQNDEIVSFIKQFQADIDRIEATFFETTTALALWHFKKNKVDACVIETGLGGRLDSTNVIVPRVTIITPVDLDHAEFLGDTIPEIAAEKAGIIKKNIPLILAPQTPEGKKVIVKTADRKNAPIDELTNDMIDQIKLSVDGTSFRFNETEYMSPLIGRHQAFNAVLAIKGAGAWDNQISVENYKDGLRRVSWPGRLQLMSKEPPIFYDVAHNPHGIRAVFQALRELGINKVIGIIALKGEKNIDQIADELENNFHSLFVVGSSESDLLDADKLAEKLIIRGVRCSPMENTYAAIQALKEAVSVEKPGLIIGSHYIAGEVFRSFDFSFDKGSI